MYQDRLGFCLDERDSWNHACCAAVQTQDRAVRQNPYLIRGVIDNEVHHQLHPSLLQLRYQIIHIFISSVPRVNGFVIGNVVAHIGLWTFVHLIGLVL